ncbi:hypothetical protein AVEN_62045-1 [Araneus ventricosus]|uniref:Uncharacterized protein n=1 Tax=Araneus ventricosus TaxID=182803 RepID=A0A4Y2JCW3_ARAVE|nr:hypothetical protein AVEN_62045-1 [Araneus ventricosus]
MSPIELIGFLEIVFLYAEADGRQTVFPLADISLKFRVLICRSRPARKRSFLWRFRPKISCSYMQKQTGRQTVFPLADFALKFRVLICRSRRAGDIRIDDLLGPKYGMTRMRNRGDMQECFPNEWGFRISLGRRLSGPMKAKRSPQIK